MKKVNLAGCGLLAAMALLASCDEGFDTSSGTGTISPLVDYDPTVISARPLSRAAEIGDITVDDLMLTLVSEDGSVNESFPASSFPADRGFKIGKYTLTASYGDPEAEGFELPAVSGEAELSVNEGKATQVSLTAIPSKAMVSVKFDEELTNYMTSCSAKLHTPGGDYIDYPATETRPVYLKPGEVSLSVDFVKPNGMGGTLEVSNFTAEPRSHYTISVKLGGNGVGEINSLIITYDETLESEEITIDISDLVLSVPAPVVTPKGFTNGEIFNCVEGSTLAASPIFNIEARGGIAKAMLSTKGQELLDAGWPAEIDLVNLNAATKATMEALGFKDLGICRNPGTIAGFDLSGVSAHIPATVATAPATEFTLVVTDKNGKESEPVGFGLKIDRLTLELSSDGSLYDGGSTVSMQLGYNGTDPVETAVTMQYLPKSGIFATVPIASVSPMAARAGIPQYIVTVNVPSDAQSPLKFKATCGSVTSEVTTIHTAPILTAPANDVFARTAWVTLSSDEADYSFTGKTIEIYGSTNGTDFTKLSSTRSGSDFQVTGLNPATTYTLRATVDGDLSRTATITTEAATQIENGNLDNGWSSEDRGSTFKGTWYHTPSPWSSLNDLTTSGSGAGTKYSIVSGTQNTTDSHDGNAALIRTVGWDLAGATPGINTPKNYTAGELFLGSYDNGANYGMDFSSRPTSVKFWYKYTPYASGEQAYVEIKVLDVAGNTISSNTQLLNTQSSYQQITLPFSYSRNAAKAAKLSVIFKSVNGSVNSNSVKKSATLGSLNDCYYGAALYIDDVELVY